MVILLLDYPLVNQVVSQLNNLQASLLVSHLVSHQVNQVDSLLAAIWSATR